MRQTYCEVSPIDIIESFHADLNLGRKAFQEFLFRVICGFPEFLECEWSKSRRRDARER